jgi:hypothetical protein
MSPTLLLLAIKTLERAREAMESAWHELEPGDGQMGDQFIRQHDMAKRIAEVDSAVRQLRIGKA